MLKETTPRGRIAASTRTRRRILQPSHRALLAGFLREVSRWQKSANLVFCGYAVLRRYPCALF